MQSFLSFLLLVFITPCSYKHENCANNQQVDPHIGGRQPRVRHKFVHTERAPFALLLVKVKLVNLPRAYGNRLVYLYACLEGLAIFGIDHLWYRY